MVVGTGEGEVVVGADGVVGEVGAVDGAVVGVVVSGGSFSVFVIVKTDPSLLISTL